MIGCTDTADHGDTSQDAPSFAEPTEGTGDELASFNSALRATTSSMTCGIICGGATAAATAACSTFALPGIVACGMASSALCELICNSKGPTSHCSTVAGGKACMNRDRFWWCDSAVDGRRVRARYELEDLSQPGVVATTWAPSKGCNAVRWPTAGLVKRWQVCAEGNGCSDWFEPNHVNATLSSYIPPGTPPSIVPPESPDITPPSVDAGGTDPNAWYQGVVPIVANAVDGESGVASITIYVNDQVIYYGAGGSAAISWDSSGYNGMMWIKVAATDGAGNTGLENFNINVSNRPPTVNFEVPSVLSSQVWFNCSVSGVGPTTQAILVDGQPVDYQHGWMSNTVGDGSHTAICRATDVMGRVTDSSKTFYVFNSVGLTWLSPMFGTYAGTSEQPIMELEASVEEADLDFSEIYENANATRLCDQSYGPGVHSAMVLDCDGANGPGRSGLNLLGRPDQEVKLWLHATAHNDYEMTTGAWWYSRTFMLDNTPPVVVLDPSNNWFEDVDGAQYVHLEATAPKPLTYYSATPDSITSVEFFAQLADGSTRSLGTTSSYPWTLTERVPDDAIEDGRLVLFAVATDTVYVHRNELAHRTGTSASLELSFQLP